MKSKPGNIIPNNIENFRVVSSGTRSVSVKKSKVNTPVGIIEVQAQTFDNVEHLSVVLLQINAEIVKSFIPLPIEGMPDAEVGRLYKNKYQSFEMTFVHGKLKDNVYVDPEFEVPYTATNGPGFGIYYVPIALIELSNVGEDLEKKRIRILRNEKMNIPFFLNYYGVGLGD